LATCLLSDNRCAYWKRSMQKSSAQRSSVSKKFRR
jgi:hypothetical protein